MKVNESLYGQYTAKYSADVVGFSTDLNVGSTMTCKIECKPSFEFMNAMNHGCTIWTDRQSPEVIERMRSPFLWQFATYGMAMLMLVSVLLKWVC